MAFLDSAINYIIQNWVSIILTIALSSIFYLLSSRGIKKLIASRQEERLKIAKESIVDVLESQIINNSDIDNDKIIHLLNATSRDRGVNLIQEYTPLDILEDLELRFAKSKHLKNEQREEYVKRIEILLRKIEEEKTIIIPPYDKVLTNLEEAIEKGDNESIKQNLNIFRSKLSSEKEKKNEPELMIDLISVIFSLIIVMSVVSNLRDAIIGSEKLMLLVVILLLLPVLYILSTRS